MQRLASLLFICGLVFMLLVIYQQMQLQPLAGHVGQSINQVSVAEIGAANLVTSVVLAYRGFDTLVELTILFTAAMAAGLVLEGSSGIAFNRPAGFILRAGADLLFPLLLVFDILLQ